MPNRLLHIVGGFELLRADTILEGYSRPFVAASLPSSSVGMEVVVRPLLVGGEPWVFVVLTALFLVLTVGLSLSGSGLVRSFKSLFFRKDLMTSFGGAFSVNHPYYQLFVIVFSICVFAMAAYLFVYVRTDGFPFTPFAVLCGAVAGYYFFKNVLFEVVGNTFFNAKIVKSYKNMYFNLMHVFSLLFYPLLVFYTYQSPTWSEPLLVCAVTLVVLFYIILIVKLIQIFYSNPLALFYIFLYLCTLEILPLLVLFRVSERLL